MRQHAIDEPGRGVRHSPAATGRAEASTLARERDEPIVSARIAMNAQESMSQDPTFEIGADLSLDEPSDGRTLPSSPSQEGLELFANDFMKQSLFRLVAFVSDGGKASIGTLRERLLPATASDVPRSPSRDDLDARLALLRSRKRLPNRGRRFTLSAKPWGLLGVEDRGIIAVGKLADLAELRRQARRRTEAPEGRAQSFQGGRILGTHSSSV